MSLIFTDAAVDYLGNIHFAGFDGPLQIVCAVTEEALHDHCGAGRVGAMQAFDDHRTTILAIASRKYEEGGRMLDGPLLWVTSADWPADA